MTLTANFDDKDYQAIRSASMRGKLDATFRRSAGGDITFRVRNGQVKRFCRQMESIVDFGATSASEVFGVDRLVWLS
jgi:hypothetical protein